MRHECAAAAPERSYDLRVATIHEGLKYLKDAAVGEQGARCMDAVFPWSRGSRVSGSSSEWRPSECDEDISRPTPCIER